MRRRFFAQVQYRGRQRCPEARGAHDVACRQAQFEPAAALRVLGLFRCAREGARLDHGYVVAVAIGEADLVEHVLVQMHEGQVESAVGHGSCVPREVLLHEGQCRRVELALVDADAEITVCDHGILVRPDVATVQFGEAERLVK